MYEDNRDVRGRCLVKIRPFWDWNVVDNIDFTKDYNVKIRPFWDWNKGTWK